MQQDWRDVFFTSQDGLKLFARDYGPQDSKPAPVLCLAGLTRNSRDFQKVASRLAKSRRVIVPDYRGRGLSEYAKDWQTYQPHVEMADAILLLDQLGIEKFAVIGTSRGGLISMVMGQTIRQRLLGVVLNDIGPKLEDEGLLRIAESINERKEIVSWQSLVDGLKKYSIGFSGLSQEDWLAFAHNLYRERHGKIEPDYDYNLTKTFPTVEFIQAGKIPEAWDLFATLKDLPMAVIRGENSDLLSIETVEKMEKAHPGLITATVPNRAHVPFLDEPEAIEAIDSVLNAL
ncbi:Hydrolase, alpha/beta fold family [hydrothermal vent metagenome]|uniref:Hydrolase, alpha/beta fold family n=1 Tax=hydrothermal vent metagenome TaxID=652676 RepID=A0A3B0RPH3_9ZZZZ